MSSPLGIPGLQRPDEIGRGGFGTVYRADEPEFNRQVAVKIIQDRVDDVEMRRAFVRECQAMGRLSGHPHIVAVHRGGTTDLGEPYIVMDLMDGGSLADRVRDEGPLPWTDVLEIGVAVAGALETAHRAGILHLDVKPANVLVSRYGEPTLADFGISRLPGVTATTDGRIRASIAYAAPERLLDGTASASSDLYSLGSTLYTLLVGEPAFTTRSGEDLLVAIARIVRQPLPDLGRHGVPDAVVHVLERLLAKSPVDRFATAADAAFALQAAQRTTGRPVTRAVIAGATAARADTRTWPVRPPPVPNPGADPADGPGDPGAQLDDDPGAPLTRPRYVPRDRVTAPAAAQPPIAIPAARHPAEPVATPLPAGAVGPVSQPDTPTLIGIPAQPWAPRPGSNGSGAGGAPPGAPPITGPSTAPRQSSFGRRLLAATALVGVLGGAVWAGLLLRSSPEVPPTLTAPVPSSTSPAPSSPTPPPRLIAVAGGVTHPDLDAVATRLDGYFRAINEQEYEAAFDYFTPDSAVAGKGLDTFRAGYSTTEVQRQRIVAVKDLTGGGVVATVTYRSTQDAEYGPSGQTCTNWSLAYELTEPGLLIRKARPVGPPRAC